MYRRRVKRHPEPVFGETLEELGYSINEKCQVVDSEGKPYTFDLAAKNRTYQEAHGLALSNAVMRLIEDRLTNEFGIKRVTVPGNVAEGDATTPRTFILASQDAVQCDKLLVLISGTMETIGTWSRRILCNDNVEAGSMYTTVKLAREAGYGVLILNPNAHYWTNCRPSIQPSSSIFIPGHESPEKHVEYVLKEIVLPAASKRIHFIVHTYGGHALTTALEAQFEVFKDRVSAVAAMAGHEHPSTSSPEFQRWWSKKTVGYIPSEAQDKGRMDFKAGSMKYSTGAIAPDQYIVESIPLIFKDFASLKLGDNFGADIVDFPITAEEALPEW